MTEQDILQQTFLDGTADELWTDRELPEQRRRKVLVNLRVDPEVLEWFKARGGKHTSCMSAVLRTYYEAHRDEG